MKNNIRLYVLLLMVLAAFTQVGNLSAQDFPEGENLIRNEQYSAALVYYSKQTVSSKNSLSWFYLGQVYLAIGKFDSARISFNRGLEIDKEQATFYAGLAKLALIEGKGDQLAVNLENVNKFSEDGNPLAMVTVAEGFADDRIKNYDEALIYTRKAVEQNRKFTHAYLSAARILLAKGNGTDAIKNCEEILKYSPGNAEALTLKARIYMLIGKTQEAIALLTEAVKHDSAYCMTYFELAEIFAAQKNYPSAIDNYSKYLSKTEITSDKQKRFAQMLFINKEYEKAVKLLEELVQSEKNSISTIRILAYSYQRLENMQKSSEYFKVLFNFPASDLLISDYDNYIELLLKSGDEQTAQVYLQKLYDIDSTRGDALGKMSVIHFKNKNWSSVISCLTKKGTLTAQEYFDLSRAYIYTGDAKINGAIASITDYLQLDFQQAASVRQSLLFYQKHIAPTSPDSLKGDKAIELLSGTIDADVKNQQKAKWNSYKTEWLQQIKESIGIEYALADSALTKLLNKSPNLAIAHLWMARVKANFDPETEYGYAKPHYERFIELAGKDVEKYKKELIESYSYLGYFSYLIKEVAASQSYWKKVLELDPANKQAADVLKMLR